MTRSEVFVTWELIEWTFYPQFTQAGDLTMVADSFKFARVLTWHSQITKDRLNGWSTVNRVSTYEVLN